MQPPAPAKVVLGISACLVGEAVRWDGGHRADWFPQELMPVWVSLRPVCPEAAIGLGVPRPPIRLEAGPMEPAVRRFGAEADGADLGPRLRAFAHEVALDDDLDGFVLAPRSPSCGLDRVPVHVSTRGTVEVVAKGNGAFAAGLVTVRPELPRIEGPELVDDDCRRAFLERIRIGAWWRRRAGQSERLAALAPLEAVLRSRGPAAASQLRREPTPAMLDALLEEAVTATAQTAALAFLGQASDGIAARVLAGELTVDAARAAAEDARVFDDPLFWGCA
ncbi:MAG TPA: DUF523 domain-containing protein [Pseudomonadales bacterium]|nr:DUF523 domain-containing protein [Pseudomonadales bacterium]